MLKKYLLTLLTIVLFIMTGCQSRGNVKDSFSEITEVYMEGKDENNKNIISSISIGKRENPYIIDGVHQENCDFSLVVIDFNKVLDENKILVSLYINDIESKLELYFNPVNNVYMNDLGYSLNQNDKIEIVYQNFNIIFKDSSKDFKVDYKLAINLSINKLKKEISDAYVNGIFEGECYLKVLRYQNQNKEDLFWAFTFVDRHSGSYNILIDVYDSKIIFSDLKT